MRQVDLKNGHELFFSNLDMIDESKPLSEQHLTEDLWAIKYSNCLIDVGWYNKSIVIQVIEIIDDEQIWSSPYAIIVCFNTNDFYVQLQRAIDIYPSNL